MTTLNTSALLSVDYGSSMSGTLNTGAGSNIQGAVFVMGDPSAITSVLVNGQAATPGRNDTGNSCGVTLYTAKNLPANSAVPVVVNFANGYAESVGIAVALNDTDPTTIVAFANGLATNYASPGMSVALTNNVNGTVLSFIATRTDTADAFSADTAHSATLIGAKSNGGTGAGAAYAALEIYPAGATSTLWNWTASGGSKPATQMAVVINPFGAAGGTSKTETGANASQGSTSSTGTATVAPAGSSGATAKTKPLAPFGGAAQIGVTVQNVVIMKLDRSIVLSLANVVTDGAGSLSATNAALVAGTVYLVSYWNADGSLRGIAKVTAV